MDGSQRPDGQAEEGDRRAEDRGRKIEDEKMWEKEIDEFRDWKSVGGNRLIKS